jgi:hypothetical protein
MHQSDDGKILHALTREISLEAQPPDGLGDDPAQRRT